MTEPEPGPEPDWQRLADDIDQAIALTHTVRAAEMAARREAILGTVRAETYPRSTALHPHGGCGGLPAACPDCVALYLAITGATHPGTCLVCETHHWPWHACAPIPAPPEHPGT